MFTLLRALTVLSLVPPLVGAAANQSHLIILDTGVGHRSREQLFLRSCAAAPTCLQPSKSLTTHAYPVSRWPTSLRSLSPTGRNAQTLQEYGPVPPDNHTTVEPTGATALGYSPSTSSLYLGTGSGLLRTDLNGPILSTISIASDVASIYVSEKTRKLYYGVSRDGLIVRSNFDGSGTEVVRNVSQGLDSIKQAKFQPSGIVVDEDEGWMYWSARRGEDDGSIRRVKLTTIGGGEEEEEEVLSEGLNMPGQLRIRGGMLYWAEKGRWLSSPTSLSRAQLPVSAGNGTMLKKRLLEGEIVVHSDHTVIFFEDDGVEKQTLGITSFAFNEDADRLWFVMESSNRVMWSKLVEVKLSNKALKLMNWETKDLGVPMGIEFFKGKGNSTV